MRLRRLKVTRAAMSGGLLDGADIRLGRTDTDGSNEHMAPLCLVGPNGSGKSQFLQLLAEIFQAAWHAHAPNEERRSANSDAVFELEYFIRPTPDSDPVAAKLSRAARGKGTGAIELHVWQGEAWRPISLGTEEFGRHLPPVVVGYTSGDNETMSLPFLLSRSGYASNVATSALSSGPSLTPADNRLLLIDYGTNLEVLFANLLLGGQGTRKAILEHARVRDIASCRCVLRLAHSAAPKGPAAAKKAGGAEGHPAH